MELLVNLRHAVEVFASDLAAIFELPTQPLQVEHRRGQRVDRVVNRGDGDDWRDMNIVVVRHRMHYFLRGALSDMPKHGNWPSLSVHGSVQQAIEAQWLIGHCPSRHSIGRRPPGVQRVPCLYVKQDQPRSSNCPARCASPSRQMRFRQPVHPRTGILGAIDLAVSHAALRSLNRRFDASAVQTSASLTVDEVMAFRMQL